jgi:two-component system LytT family response regulator
VTAAGAPSLRVLIADDEGLARRRLLRLLSAMPDVQIAGECADGDEVLDRVRGGAVDVVLLDVQMPGLTGLDTLALFPADGPVVIFCTAHAAHAVAAFDVGAVDYLLKPIEAARLQKALDRARDHDARRRFGEELARHRGAGAGVGVGVGVSLGGEARLNRLALPTRQGLVLVDPQEVSHAVLEEGGLVRVMGLRAEWLCDRPLQELEERLAGDGFVRVHRRALLNLHQVERLEPCETGGFIARTRGGHAVDVSRQAARDLRRKLGLR